MSFEIVQDSIVVQLSAEKSIPSDTVRVSVGITMSVTAAEAGDVRATITSKLKDMLDAEWSLTSLDRRPDASGREQVQAAAVTRVPEAEAACFAYRAKQASTEGFQVIPGLVDYSPPKSVVADAKIELRKKLYEMAHEETILVQQSLKSLTSNAADRQWRVAGIDFADAPYVVNNSMIRSTASATAHASIGNAPGGAYVDGNEVGLTQKVSLFATVTIARVVVNPVD
jgi:hypothetical protein